MKISRSEIFYLAQILTYSNILCNYANPTIRQKSACRICEIRQPILKFVGFGRHSDNGSIRPTAGFPVGMSEFRHADRTVVIGLRPITTVRNVGVSGF
jgi:hypothetical protein